MDSIAWEQCIVCLQMTDDVPHCPANSKRSDVGIGYETFAKDLKSFQELGQMPVPIDIEKLSIEDLKELFMNHAAKWHKKCRDKFNATKLQRMKKKLSKDVIRVQHHRHPITSASSVNLERIQEISGKLLLAKLMNE